MESTSEKTVAELHDVCLVNASDFLTTVCLGKGEGESGNSLRFHAGDDLEGLDDTWNGLVLKARIFTLSILTDQTHVDIGVAGLVAWDVLDKDN